jgi:putative acetyltransferase
LVASEDEDRACGVTIRVEEPGDHDSIALVVAAAFGRPAEARLVEAIRASANYIAELSLVAESDGHIVGHVMVSLTALHDGDTVHRIAHLSPLTVAPDHQGLGIGSVLVREVTVRADDRGEPSVVLEGSPLFCGRLGFDHSVPYAIHITLPSWAPPEAAQILRLRNYIPLIKGRVVYPPAFDDVTEARGHGARPSGAGILKVPMPAVRAGTETRIATSSRPSGIAPGGRYIITLSPTAEN